MDRRTAIVSRSTSWPATRAVPLVGRSAVVRMRMSVVLPAPFWPSSPNSSPGSIRRLTPPSAGRAVSAPDAWRDRRMASR